MHQCTSLANEMMSAFTVTVCMHSSMCRCLQQHQHHISMLASLNARVCGRSRHLVQVPVDDTGFQHGHGHSMLTPVPAVVCHLLVLQSFKTVSAAIGSHPGHMEVKLEFQRC
jgi:hypothetical protein